MPHPSTHPAIRRVAIVGAGTIGASWAALFLAHGLKWWSATRRPMPSR